MELQISRVIGVKPKVIIKNGCRNELVMRGGALARVSLSLSLSVLPSVGGFLNKSPPALMECCRTEVRAINVRPGRSDCIRCRDPAEWDPAGGILPERAAPETSLLISIPTKPRQEETAGARIEDEDELPEGEESCGNPGEFIDLISKFGIFFLDPLGESAPGRLSGSRPSFLCRLAEGFLL